MDRLFLMWIGRSKRLQGSRSIDRVRPIPGNHPQGEGTEAGKARRQTIEA